MTKHKNLKKQIISHLEDLIDRKAVQDTNYKKGKRFEKIVQELSIGSH